MPRLVVPILPVAGFLAQRIEFAVQRQDQRRRSRRCARLSGVMLDALRLDLRDLVGSAQGSTTTPLPMTESLPCAPRPTAAATACRSCRRPRACGRHCGRPGSAPRCRRAPTASRRSCPCLRRPIGSRRPRHWPLISPLNPETKDAQTAPLPGGAVSPYSARWQSGRTLSIFDGVSGCKPLGESPASPRRRPSRATAAAPRRRSSQPWRRSRCASPAAPRDRRRCPWRHSRRSSSAAIASAKRHRAARRQRQHVGIDDLEADRGVRAGLRHAREEIDPGRPRDPIGDDRGVGVGARDRAVEAADAFDPIERVEIILEAQHRRRVDGRALEQLASSLPSRVMRKSFGSGQGGV